VADAGANPVPEAAVSAQGRPQRLVGADLVRAVATVGVVSIHAAFWGFGYDRLSRFSVPAFVILSGALLQAGYADRPRGADFLRRRFLRSLLPWIVWAAVYFVIGTTLTNDVSGSKGALSWWLYGGGHLWFLLLIPQLYIVFALWPRGRLAACAAAALVLQVTLGAERLLTPVSLDSAVAQVTLWRGFLLFPFWIGYFALGIALAGWLRRPPTSWRWIGGAGAATLLTAVLFGGVDLVSAGSPDTGGATAHVSVTAAWGDWDQGTGAFLNPLLIPFVTAFVVLTACAGTRWLREGGTVATAVRRLSEWSLAVYILHPVLLDTVIGRIVPRWDGVAGQALGDVVRITFTLVLAMVLAALLERTPLAITLGLTRRPLRGAARTAA
jgi:surface polysaccharide O-acyltransferase-like enzyme